MLRKLLPNKLNLNQVGDTIVEVLIATVIIGSMLVGAFALSDRSLVGQRQAEETTEANEILQGQMEQLRAYLETGNSIPTGVSGLYYCMTITSPPGGQPGYTPYTGAYNNCVFQNSTAGEVGTISGDPNYQVKIFVPPTVLSGTKYTATATWKEIGGGNGTINLSEVI